MADGPLPRPSRGRGAQQESGSERSMSRLRRRIDRLDEEIITRLVARFRLMEEAAHIKGERGRIHDAERIAEVLRQAGDAASAAGAPPQAREAIVELYRLLVRQSIRYEFMVFDRDRAGDA